MSADSKPCAVGPAWPFYVCGASVFGALAGVAGLDPGAHPVRLLASMSAAAIVYLVALLRLGRCSHPNRTALVVCLLMAGAWRVPLLLGPPTLSTDMYRYIWDGRLQRLGYSPYLIVPADPAVDALHNEDTRQMSNPTFPTPYPAGAQLFFRVVTAIDESVFMMKLAMVTCDALIALVLLRWLVTSGRSPWWTLAYAWNPLVAIEGAGNGHVDFPGVLCLTIAAFALTRRWRTLAAVAFALAVSVKFIPAVLAPLFWRRVRARDIMVAALVFIALYIPFLNDGRIPIGSFRVYFVENWRFNDPLFSLVARALPSNVAGALAVTAGVAAAWAARLRLSAVSPIGWAWPTAALLMLAPIIYPWYLLWLTPFLTAAANAPLTLWTLASLSTYIVWSYWSDLGEWILPSWVFWFEYGLVAAACGWVVLGLRTSARDTTETAGGQASQSPRW